jgi:hypothetical protein
MRTNETIVGEREEITDWSGAMQEKNCEICDASHFQMAKLNNGRGMPTATHPGSNDLRDAWQ